MGMGPSWLMRFHLVWPQREFPAVELLSKAGAPGGIITPEYYLSLLTMHGTLMDFFVAHQRPLRAFGQLLSPDPDRRGRYGFPRSIYVVLDDARRVSGADPCVRHSRRSADLRLDLVCSFECGRQGRRPGMGWG